MKDNFSYGHVRTYPDRPSIFFRIRFKTQSNKISFFVMLSCVKLNNIIIKILKRFVTPNKVIVTTVSFCINSALEENKQFHSSKKK